MDEKPLLNNEEDLISNEEEKIHHPLESKPTQQDSPVFYMYFHILFRKKDIQN